MTNALSITLKGTVHLEFNWTTSLRCCRLLFCKSKRDSKCFGKTMCRSFFQMKKITYRRFLSI